MSQVIKWADYYKSTTRPPAETTLTLSERTAILDRLIKLGLFNRAFHWAMHMMEVAR
ncbi:hypothetical protein LCGC14_1579460 [marine sediment metagenome]|uniref:Uncharacterized protein n=1 Tax=marine sediment metagenome TaxID=412755 RepID=A0A0F9LHJ2_9ZZZZ